MNNILEIAISIATEAHKGQKDKGGNDYILHPLRVMDSVNTIDEKIVAILHDVIEDSDMIFDDLLQKGIPENLINVLRLLTHDSEIPYFDYIKSISENPIAKSVKLADLKDNSNLNRIPNPTKKDLLRIEKYKEAIKMLHTLP